MRKAPEMLRARLTKKARLLSTHASHGLESMAARLIAAGRPTPYEAQVIADLKSEGVHVTSIERLLPDRGLHAELARASAFINSQPPRDNPVDWVWGASSLDLSAESLIQRFPGIFLLGLDERVLRLARLYLHLPIAYHGAVVRHSLVDNGYLGPRIWHRDAEDLHVLRMVIYMNDVSPGGGPFEYIPRNCPVRYKHVPNMKLTSDVVEKFVPRERWRQIFAPAGTVILCDSAKTFHHESLQTERPRTVVMIGYSSRRPFGRSLAQAHFPVERVRDALVKIVPQANHAHVFGWRAHIA
jgi:hypothetical protein